MLFSAVFQTVQILLTISMATIAGYMVIGGIGGSILMMCGVKQIVPYAPAVGWILGAILGVGNEVHRLRKEARKKAKTAAGSVTDVSTTDVSTTDGTSAASTTGGYTFRVPPVGEFFKCLGFGSVFGVIIGVGIGMLLSVVLISVTTSPFVPASWRPQTAAPDREDRSRDRRTRTRRDGVGTEFRHPLLGSIFGWSCGSCIVLGFVGGGVGAFFTEKKLEDTAGSS